MVKRVCEWCEIEFMAKSRKKRFCSASCQYKNYYHTHPAVRRKQIENSRRRVLNDPEAMAVVLAAGQRWRENNREKARASTKRWESEHKEHCARKNREWWTANPEKRHEYNQRFRTENPEKIRRWEKNNTYRRRALKKEAAGSFTYEEFLVLCNETGWICSYCGCQLDSETATADHMIPLSRGGSNDIGNIAPACVSCNCRKKDKTPEEYESWLKIREVAPNRNL